jgi:membrane protein implicated in regulation of membrane protease activity
MDVLLTFTHWHWFVGALIFAMLEMLLPGVIFLWMGLSAILIGFLVLVLPDLALEYQLIGFAVLSIVTAVIARSYVGRKADTSDHPTLNERSTNFVGQTYLLQQDSINKVGKVKIGDTVWRVDLQEDAKANAPILITEASGLILKGQRAD